MCHQNKYTYCLPNTLILPCFEGLTPAIAILFAGVVSSLSASLVISKLNVVTNNEVHAAHFKVHIIFLLYLLLTVSYQTYTRLRLTANRRQLKDRYWTNRMKWTDTLRQYSWPKFAQNSNLVIPNIIVLCREDDEFNIAGFSLLLTWALDGVVQLIKLLNYFSTLSFPELIWNTVIKI